MIDLVTVRKDTPGVDKVAHFNNAGAALMPQPVLDAVFRHLECKRDFGGTEVQRRAISEGIIEGPTIYNAGKIISVFGRQTSGIPYEIGPLWSQEYIDVMSGDDMRRAIHENVYYGAKLIKLVLGNCHYQLSDEVLAVAVEETS